MFRIFTFLILAVISFSNLNATVIGLSASTLQFDNWVKLFGDTNTKTDMVYKKDANNWDIAFDMTILNQNAGIYINDNKGYQVYFVGNSPDIWNTIPDTNKKDTWEKCFNNDSTWHIGAFNRNQNGFRTFFDYGWGNYDQQTHNVIGSALFVIYKSGVWVKFMVDTLNGTNGSYSFKIALLNGLGQQSFSIPYNPSKLWVYFSIDTKQIVDREPDTGNWDIVFSKYNHYTASQNQNIVFGVRQNEGTRIRTLKLENIDTSAITSLPLTQFNSYIANIGSDWYNYDAVNKIYTIAPKRAYLIQRVKKSGTDYVADGDMYKMIFNLFDINAGEITYNASPLKNTSVETNPENNTSLYLLNNIIEKSDAIEIAISSEIQSSGTISIFDLIGNLIYTKNIEIKDKLSNLNINGLNISSGMYVIKLNLNNGSQTLTNKFIVR